MKTIVHPHGSRGHANHGWLRTSHSFSFAQWHDPERMNFGALRVLNDDCVVGGAGFGAHPHDNMEILSIPLSGALEHKDNMGNQTTIQEGEVQIMSAGPVSCIAKKTTTPQKKSISCRFGCSQTGATSPLRMAKSRCL